MNSNDSDKNKGTDLEEGELSDLTLFKQQKLLFTVSILCMDLHERILNKLDEGMNFNQLKACIVYTKEQIKSIISEREEAYLNLDFSLSKLLKAFKPLLKEIKPILDKRSYPPESVEEILNRFIEEIRQAFFVQLQINTPLKPVKDGPERLPERWDGLDYDKMLNTVVNGECLRETPEYLNSVFQSNKIDDHYRARQIIADILDWPDLLNHLGLESALRELNTTSQISLFTEYYEVGGNELSDKEVFKRIFREFLWRQWQNDKRIFPLNAQWNNKNLCERIGFDFPTALKLPFVLRSDSDWIKIDANEALRFQLLTLEANHSVLDIQRGYREAYALARRASEISENLNVTKELPSPNEIYFFGDEGKSYNPDLHKEHLSEVKAPLLKFFDREKTENQEELKNKARKFIYAMISLILPDKAAAGKKSLIKENGDLVNIVQEDLIITNLRAIAAEFSMEEEFFKLFRAIHLYRRLQTIYNYHFNPTAPSKQHREHERKMSITEVCQETYEKIGKLGIIASIGSGKDCLLEEILVQQNFADRAINCDLTNGSPVLKKGSRDSLTFYLKRGEEQPNNASAKGILSPMDIKRNYKLKNRLNNIMHLFRTFCPNEQGYDILLSCDMCHESEDSKSYFIKPFDLLRAYGLYYFSDPVHSDLDFFSPTTVLKTDSTQFPTSNLNHADITDFVAYLLWKGEDIRKISIVPATFAGMNDPYWRESVVMQKIPEHERICELQDPDMQHLDFTTPLNDDFQIFSRFPFNLIESEEDRNLLINVLRERIKNEEHGIFNLTDIVLEKEVKDRSALQRPIMRELDVTGPKQQRIIDFDFDNLPVPRTLTFSDVLTFVAKVLSSSREDIRESNKAAYYAEEVNIMNSLIRNTYPWGADFPARLFKATGLTDFELIKRHEKGGVVLTVAVKLFEKYGINIFDPLLHQPGWKDVKLLKSLKSRYAPNHTGIQKYH